MARSTGNSGKLTSGNRSAVRVMLATGATLATLISAQMFAGSAAVQSASQTVAVSAVTQDTSSAVAASPTTTVTTTTDDDTTAAQTSTTTLVTTSNTQSSIFAAQTQPNPGSRSSR